MKLKPPRDFAHRVPSQLVARFIMRHHALDEVEANHG